MAKRKNVEATGSEETADPIATPASAEASENIAPENQAENAHKVKLKSELPAVESPSISPAVYEAGAISDTPIEPKPEPEVVAVRPAPLFTLVPLSGPSVEQATEPPNKQAPPRFALKARHKRYAVLAASVAIGAALGAVIGALTTGGLATASKYNVAALEENKAMQQSLTRLAKDITTLKANLEASNKLAQNQTAERLKQARAEITGSISAPQTVTVAPVPTPRPAPRIAAAESLPSARPPVVQDWSIRDTRGGYVYVEGHGDIYQIVPGAPLPGLGPVQSVKKLAGRWVVTTPKGIIVSMRDRRFFE